MSELITQSCEACRADAPRVSDQELIELSKEIPAWTNLSRNGVLQLERSFKFKNFRDALAFTNRVGEMAEQQGHHPDIYTAWGKVTVTWWSHSIKGLHKNDFICAAKTDSLQ